MKIFKIFLYVLGGLIGLSLSLILFILLNTPSIEQRQKDAAKAAEELKQYCLSYHEDEIIFKGTFPRATLEKAEKDLDNCRKTGHPVKNENTMKSLLSKRRSVLEKQEKEYSDFVKKHGPTPENYESKVLRALKSVARNPDSVFITECKHYYGHKKGWEIICSYRAQNGFGGMNFEEITLYYSNGNVSVK